MDNYNPKVDAYIANAAEFAQPILIHLRQLVHQAHPEIKEAIKWGFPFFDDDGPICQMAAFKQHMGFGFWKAGLLADPNNIIHKEGESSAGSLGKICSLADLPPDEILIEYIRRAVELNKSGIRTIKPPKKALDKKDITTPNDFLEMLNDDLSAKTHYNNFSASKQKEYIEWFAEAKTEATRQKRMQQALEWIAEGKSRNWKYQ